MKYKNDVVNSNCIDVVYNLSCKTSFGMFNTQQALLQLDHKSKHNFDLAPQRVSTIVY